MLRQDIWNAIQGWARNTKREIQKDGVRGLTRQLRYSMLAAPRRMLQPIGKVINYGDSIWGSEWDLLIVLDACRPDLVKEVTDDFEFLSTNTRYSNASQSLEWLEKNLGSEVPDNTAYVTANPFSDALDIKCDHVEQVWKYGWDDELGTIPPQKVTDAAIRIGRQESYDRVIVHYMQPHYPFIPDPLTNGFDSDTPGNTGGEGLWQMILRGELSVDDVWKPYTENLSYVLNDVERLLSNFDARTAVITADHANAMGEWFTYGHIKYAPVPAMKRVPWCTTEATDTEDYVTDDKEEQNQERERDAQLEALGYH